MGITLIWPKIQVQLPTVSSWQFGSTSTSSASIAVFGDAPTITGAFITIPINRVTNGSIVETAILSGPAVNAGESSGLQMPAVNGVGSTASAFGLGSYFALGPMAPPMMQAADFEGVVIVGTPAGPALKANATSLVMFVPDSFLELGPVASTSIKAVGVTFGMQSATAIAQTGTNVLAYRVRVASDTGSAQTS